jgi:hypothetical protein
MWPRTMSPAFYTSRRWCSLKRRRRRRIYVGAYARCCLPALADLAAPLDSSEAHVALPPLGPNLVVELVEERVFTVVGDDGDRCPR